jgi:hypothetical protein
MVPTLLVCAALLSLQAPEPPGPGETGKAAPKAPDGGPSAETLATYNRLREKTPETAAAQWKLGLWCEQNGLSAEAYVHFSAVVQLDPGREAAWRKLGLKKFDGRWLTDARIAEEKEQKKLEAVWVPRLRKIHRDIHGTNGAKKQEAAQAALDAIADPAAVSSVYREFAGGGERDQLLAVQVLGHIDKPVSSKVLALMAVYGKTPEVRRRATETLRGRDAEEFLDLLVGLLVDPLKYEVKAVGGPGSPGVLFVEGERFNVRRFYAAPPPPEMTPRPGDMISYDQFGMPVITRTLGPSGPRTGVAGSKTLALEHDRAVQISATQNLLEAQRTAAASQAQLESDVARINSLNDDRKKFNELVIAAMKSATGKDRGRTPKEWRDALALRGRSDRQPSQTPSKLTVDEVAPLAYNPTFAQLGFTTKVVVDT